MPRIRKKQGTFAPPSGRRRKMVRDTMPMATRKLPWAPAPKAARPTPTRPEKVAAASLAGRVREADGTLRGDDPTTPNVDEAWTDGAGPEWTSKDNKARLLEVALGRGLEDLTMMNTKKQLIEALEKSDT